MRLWRSRSPVLVKTTFYAMGTIVSVTVAPGDAAHRRAAEAAMREVEQLMMAFGREAWAWGSGALADFNHTLAGGDIATIPAALKPLFARAWSLREATGGRFEPRVASLIQLWGFDCVAHLRSEPPTHAEVEKLVAALREAPPYDGGDHYGPAPLVGWDFGAIGKGFIVDAALDLLRERGFTSAIVDAGGNLAVRGKRGDSWWRIGIREPLDNAEPGAVSAFASLMAVDESVNTHGNDQRYFDHGGRRYAHVLDPRTGWPVQGLRALTVVHPDGSWAEAAGAALFVAGAKGWRAEAARLGLEQVLAITEDGTISATLPLAARLRARDGTTIRAVA